MVPYEHLPRQVCISFGYILKRGSIGLRGGLADTAKDFSQVVVLLIRKYKA